MKDAAAPPAPLTAADVPELFRNYQGLVYRTASWLLGDHAEAEDAVQEVFLAVYRFVGRYDPQRGAVSTWLYRLTVNHCRQRLTRRRWRWWPRLTEATPAPGRELDEAEAANEVRRLLAALPPDLRAVVVLRYSEGRPYQEIADILGLPLGTVKSRHGAALERLRAADAKREVGR